MGEVTAKYNQFRAENGCISSSVRLTYAFNEAKALSDALVWPLSPRGYAGREPERGVLIRFDGAVPA